MTSTICLEQLKPVGWSLRRCSSFYKTTRNTSSPRSPLDSQLVSLFLFRHFVEYVSDFSGLLCFTGCPYYWLAILQQVDLCFYLTKGSLGSSVEMVIIGVKRRMEGLLGKRTSDLRSVKYVYEFNTLISFFFFLIIFLGTDWFKAFEV
jgi:hypothetical protein